MMLYHLLNGPSHDSPASGSADLGPDITEALSLIPVQIDEYQQLNHASHIHTDVPNISDSYLLDMKEECAELLTNSQLIKPVTLNSKMPPVLVHFKVTDNRLTFFSLISSCVLLFSKNDV